MASYAEELTELSIALADAPGPHGKDPGGLTQKDLAAKLNWPVSLVNERLLDLGRRVRHHKVSVMGSKVTKYILTPIGA